MTSADQLKVIRAGFKIIRADENQLIIKFKDNENLDWKILEKGFKSKAELNRRKSELLNLSNIIED